MLGLSIDKNSLAFKDFPTDSFFDWQWTELVKNARVINLERLPKNLQPIVQPIDDWNRNYKLGMIFEVRVERGKCSFRARIWKTIWTKESSPASSENQF